MAKYRGVAFAGFGGVGKSEATSYACALLDAKRVHVKDVLGECIAPMLLRLGVSVPELHDYVYGAKKDAPLPLAPELSAVKLLQAQGNGFLLDCGDPMLAQRLVLDKFPETIPVVNESLRYPREAAYLKSRGLFIVRITRPGYDGKRTLDGALHESERGALEIDADAEILNDGDLSKLFAGVREVLDYAGFYITREQRTVGHVVVVNGKPRAGKDEFCALVAKYCEARWMIPVGTFSTIDPVRELLAHVDVDVTQKRPEDRRLLSVLGEELERHSDFKTKTTLRRTGDHATRGIAFVHAREGHTIEKLRSQVECMLPRSTFSTLWLSRPGYDHPEPSNDSDRIDGSEVCYDWSVANSGSLLDLEFAAARFADLLLSGAATAHVNALGMSAR